MKKIAIKLVVVTGLGVLSLFGAHNYAKYLVQSVIQEEIAAREPQIQQEMRSTVEQALHDPEIQREVQGMLNQAVTHELETNGEKHVTSIIERRYPHLLPFLHAAGRSD